MEEKKFNFIVLYASSSLISGQMIINIIQVRKDVDADVKKAKADGELDADELYYDIYEQNLEGKIRGLNPWDRWEHKKTQTAVNL